MPNDNAKIIDLMSIEERLSYMVLQKDHIRVCHLPPDWKFHRDHPGLIRSFLGTKKIFVTRVNEYKKSVFQPQRFDQEVNISRTFIIDLIEPPYQASINELNDRNNWLTKLKLDDNYSDTREFYQLYGDIYILDYDIEKIIEKIDQIE